MGACSSTTSAVSVNQINNTKASAGSASTIRKIALRDEQDFASPRTFQASSAATTPNTTNGDSMLLSIREERMQDLERELELELDIAAPAFSSDDDDDCLSPVSVGELNREESFSSAICASIIVGMAEAGDYRKVRLLIEAGEDVNACDKDGNTCLHIAAARGFDDIAWYLLANGADVAKKNILDETPLHEAARRSHLKIVQWLLAAGASASCPNEDGDVALECARKSKAATPKVQAVVTFLSGASSVAQQ